MGEVVEFRRSVLRQWMDLGEWLGDEARPPCIILVLPVVRIERDDQPDPPLTAGGHRRRR